MEIYLDTANTDYIEKYLVPYNLSGVTCNPSILAKDKQDWEVLAQLVKGDKKLFVQVLATDTAGMVKEALQLREKYDIIIKVPCSSEGYKAMVELKKAGVPIYLPQRFIRLCRRSLQPSAVLTMWLRM